MYASAKDKALEYLNKSFEERYFAMVGLGVDHAFDWMRDDPRFKEIVRKVGIPE